MTLPRYILLTGNTFLRESTDHAVEFDLERPYTFCRICGTLYQTANDRLITKDTNNSILAVECLADRKEWSRKHAKLHTEQEHLSLALSGLLCTPQATFALAPFGIFTVSDIAIDHDNEQAGLEAERMPTNDVEGARY